MKRLKLYALANEFVLPADDKPIYMQFGTWPFNDRIMQTFDLGCAKNIITALANEVAAGSPGTPVYQGHPDVAHLAHKYPDKSAWGWIKRIELANERHEPCNEGEATGVLMHVDWVTRPKAHAFEYFSPYWIGTETAPMNGKTHMLANEMRSVALLNYPNIKDFRLPNEEPEELMKTKIKNFNLMLELASRHSAANETNYDESKHPRAEDGKWTSGGGAGGGSSGSGKSSFDFGAAMKKKREEMKWDYSNPDHWNAALKYRSELAKAHPEAQAAYDAKHKRLISELAAKRK